jgi:hypothetical protein
MTQTLGKVMLMSMIFMFTFGVVSYFIGSDMGLNTAVAATTCGDCEPDPEPPTGGGGGGSTSHPPSCTIRTNIAAVRAGNDYVITWEGTPTSATFKVNNSIVRANDSATYTMDAGTEYARFVIYGINADGECSEEVVVYQEIVTPVCDITANVSAVAIDGDYTITWVGTPSDATFKINGSPVNDRGSVTFTFVGPNKETYTLTGDNNGETCSDTVEVVKETTLVPACEYLRAAPMNLPYGGGTTLLTWETTNATSVHISGVGSVNLDNTNGRPVSVTQTTTFVLTANNAAGSDDCQVTVEVAPQNTVVQCNYLTAAPKSFPYGGGTTLLKWETTNATKVVISGIGEVNLDNTNGRPVSVTQTTTFILTATDADGSHSCEETVTVGQINNGISCAQNVDFTASRYSIDEGESTLLTWNTNGITSLSINGVSSRALDDSETVAPRTNTTYTLTATDGFETIYCPLSIDVDEDNGGGGSSSPRCDLDISDENITAGEEVTIEWNTSNTDEITLKDNHGNILVESDDNDDLDGSIKIRPTEDTTFTLIAEDGSRDDECEVEVEVEGGVTVTETRTQLPTIAGISLSQVPYTGFEAGPMLTTIFYGLLTIWGLFVAYLVAVRRNMIGGVSLVGAHDHVTFTDVSSEAPGDVAPVADYVASATVPANLPTGIAPVVGYAAAVVATDDVSTEMTELENRAHGEKALFSSDAMRYFMKVTPVENRLTALDAIIANAKTAFPSEDGWLVINLTRLESLLETTNAAATIATEVTAGNGGSLAEAIVTGNIVAAYQLIAHRPMIALADAAAELDSVVRARRGEAVSISNMLASQTASLTDAQVTAAIKALTSALDGVYTSEEEAVKMAIMKAVKAVV